LPTNGVDADDEENAKAFTTNQEPMGLMWMMKKMLKHLLLTKNQEPTTNN